MLLLFPPVTSLSGAALAPNPRYIQGGVYLVHTVNGDVFTLDYDSGTVTKNQLGEGKLIDFAVQIAEGRASLRNVGRKAEQLTRWTYGFHFASICEPGYKAKLMVGGDNSASVWVGTEEVVRIEQVA